MTSIFIRTYINDLNWLGYCLKSIHKNLKGWDEIVVCIPKGQESLLSHLTEEKIVTCKIYKDDYLFQQVSKLKAHEYCKGNYILYVDSDVIFYPNADVGDYFLDNKPVLLKDKYENVGDAICWKKPTEKLFKENIDYEYMRDIPLLYHKSTLEMFNQSFLDIENHVMSQPHRQFSEFNVLGYYAEKMQPESYHIIDLSKETYKRRSKSKQFWSWSGLTQAERIEIEGII
jgi:hypothetical protein